MDELTSLIKKTIKQKYSSTRRFALDVNIPQTTIVSALNNGVNGTSFETVQKICNSLNIKFAGGVYPLELSENAVRLLEKISKLDEKGLHTVATVTHMEYLRCLAEAEKISLAETSSKNEIESITSLIEADEIPTKSEISDILKAFNDEEEISRI